MDAAEPGDLQPKIPVFINIKALVYATTSCERLTAKEYGMDWHKVIAAQESDIEIAREKFIEQLATGRRALSGAVNRN